MKKLLALIVSFCFVLTGCDTAAPAPATGQDTVVVAMGPTSEPDSGFDPAYGWGAGEHVHEPLIQSTLTVTTQDLQIAYDLATDLTVSQDGLVWTATLRQDAFFTNGQQLTAADVAFTYNTVKELSTVNDFTMLERAEATGDFTVVFYLHTPYSIWPYSMANVGIVPADGYDASYGQAPIGSGRYKMVQWDKGQQVIFEANPDYYGQAPIIKKVVVLFMTEDAAFAAVKSGQVDIAYTAAAYSQQQVKGYSLFRAETVDNRGFNLPAVPATADNRLGNDVTCDAALRQALNMGLDRQAVIDNVLYGYGTPAYSVCDKMPWFNEGSVIEHDRDGALALLDDAGWAVGGDGIRSKNGVRASLRLLYPASDSVRQAIAAETANQLIALGIEASFEGVGWDEAYTLAQSTPLAWGWGAHTPMELYNIYHTAPGSEYAAYSPYANATVDTLMDKALATTDLNESFEVWKQAQTELETDMAWVWLVNIDHLYWVRDGLNVAQQKIHPHGHGWSIVNNIDTWSWN